MIPDSATRSRELARVGKLFRQGRASEAEQLLLRLLASDRHDRELLEALADFYLATRRSVEAAHVLERLVGVHPTVADNYFRLAALLERESRWAEMAALYARMAAALPALAVAHFNHGCYLGRSGSDEQALAAYHRALELGIEQPAEVWCNIATAHSRLRRDGEARAALRRAIALDPRFVPALYNLALLHEEFGEREEALELFRRIIAIDPHYQDALVRIAHVVTVGDAADPLLKQLETALKRRDLDAISQENLHFALGKCLDDCHRHDAAFAHYRQGNAHSRARLRPYDRAATEAEFDQVLRIFGSDWLRRVEPVSAEPLLFICGMFRSGSTLIEQVLATHPRVTAGGEIDYFNRCLRHAQPPLSVADPVADRPVLQQLGNGYLDYLRRTFPGGGRVSNKRPDNFVYLGLLKGLFPNAQFVNTVRDPLDTCLSIWFQQLEDSLGYACSLEDTAHYLMQYQRLMKGWKALFGASIFDADYDAFTFAPEAELQRLLAFLGLDWDEACLRFTGLGNRVRTASVWQVRKPIYRDSSGRWRHYEQQLSGLRQLFGR